MGSSCFLNLFFLFCYFTHTQKDVTMELQLRIFLLCYHFATWSWFYRGRLWGLFSERYKGRETGLEVHFLWLGLGRWRKTTGWSSFFLPRKSSEHVKVTNSEAENFSKTSGSVKRPSASQTNIHAPILHVNIKRELAYAWGHSTKNRTQRMGLNWRHIYIMYNYMYIQL